MRVFEPQAFIRLNERIDRLLEHGEISQRSQALVHLFMTHRFYAEQNIIRESFTDGGNDCGIDAVHIDRRGDEPIIHLFQSKVFDSARRAKNPFPASCLDKVLRFMEILTDHKINLKKVVNAQLEQKVLEIRDAVDREFPIFKVWLISNGMPCLEHESRPVLQALERQSVKVEEFHLDEVVEFCLNNHSARTNHVFYARDSGIIESGNTELRSVVGYISGLQLYKLLSDLRDPRKIDYTLFKAILYFAYPLQNRVGRASLTT